MPAAALPAPPGQRTVAGATVAQADQVTQSEFESAAGIAIITGAGAGLGRALARGLASAGYGILAADIDGARAAACANQARAFGVPAQAVWVDLRDPLYLERIVAVAEEWGRTEVLVSANAGGWPSPVAEVTAKMCLSDLVREPMRLRGGGAIVNVVPAVSTEAAALIRFTEDRSFTDDRSFIEDRSETCDGVRLMCLTTDQPLTAPAAVVTAVLDLIRRGRAGTVLELRGAAPVAQPRFVRGTASVA